jgi:hypothetical protein
MIIIRSTIHVFYYICSVQFQFQFSSLKVLHLEKIRFCIGLTFKWELSVQNLLKIFNFFI